ncbi:MAG: ABC transporter permease [Planctomycetes bacterium]|nr:ABC transporter permease [Planctomycetota bacterium]
MKTPPSKTNPPLHIRSDVPFYVAFIIISSTYLLLLLAMLLADASYMFQEDSPAVASPEWSAAHPWLAVFVNNPIVAALSDDNIQYSIVLSLVSCTITAILSLIVAIPVGYLLSRHQFFGRNFIDAVLDIPIVLPPLVVGLSLLILFQYAPVAIREQVVYQLPAVVLAQFVVACAFAVRTMRATFDLIDTRREKVALTLGCNQAQAFFRVVLPEARAGVLTAGTLAWARALGEFGPLLVFAGATRGKTEVLSTTVFLELSIGDLGAAVAVSLIMIMAAAAVLIVIRTWGANKLTL